MDKLKIEGNVFMTVGPFPVIREIIRCHRDGEISEHEAYTRIVAVIEKRPDMIPLGEIGPEAF